MQEAIDRLRAFNKKVNIIFTVSPVRHIRDGVIENNRSKARLLEAVHQLVESNVNTFYFPAYELVIDVLRDYRFYDIDLVHPNYAATEHVFQQFEQTFIETAAKDLMDEIRKIVTSYKHKPFQPSTQQHQQFMSNMLSKVKSLQEKMPQLDFSREITYFSRRNNL